MLKFRAVQLAGLLLLSLILVACGSAAGGNPAPAVSIQAGAQAMRQALAGVQKAVEAADVNQAKAGGDALEAAWAKFEDAVKAKDKALYGQIEEPLGAIEAGVKATPMDLTTLAGQIRKLDGLLAPLAK